MAPLTGSDAASYITRDLAVMRRALAFGPVARWIARSQVRAFGRDPEQFLRRGLLALPPVDQTFVEDAEWREHAIAASAEFYASAEPFLDEYRSALGPWGFDLSDVQCPVVINHGALDTVAPAAMATWLSAHLASAELRVDPDRGHFLATDRLADLLRTMAVGNVTS
jgi:pimeloyl-ACP methyl ester carboxylesterase